MQTLGCTETKIFFSVDVLTTEQSRRIGITDETIDVYVLKAHANFLPSYVDLLPKRTQMCFGLREVIRLVATVLRKYSAYAAGNCDDFHVPDHIEAVQLKNWIEKSGTKPRVEEFLCAILLLAVFHVSCPKSLLCEVHDD